MNGIWRLYASAAGIVLAVLLLAAGILAASGVLQLDRLRDAATVLRDGLPAPVQAVPMPPATADEAAQRQASEARVRKEDELRRLEGRIAARLAQADAERSRLLAEREAFDVQRRDTVPSGNDADLAANVPILIKMDGASIVTVLRGWDNATFVRYLRALKPSKAAEVLDALQTDETFEQEFRRVPPGSPRGTRTRAELLMDEFKKAPQG